MLWNFRPRCLTWLLAASLPFLSSLSLLSLIYISSSLQASFIVSFALSFLQAALLSFIFFLMGKAWLEEARWRQAGFHRLNRSTRHGICGMSRRGKGRRPSRAVERRVRTLQRLVPGGRRLQQEQLFLRTADYIFLLRLQVHVLRELSKLYLP